MMHEPLWQNRNFRLVFGASMFSHLGTWVYGVALPWLATSPTRNPLRIGMVAMAPQSSWVFFALHAEVWTDRLDHHATIVRGKLLMAAMTLAVVGLALWAAPSLPAVLALAAALGPFALHLPFAFATFGGISLLAYCAPHLRLD